MAFFRKTIKKRKCMKCGKFNVGNPKHDYCLSCFKEVRQNEKKLKPEETFEDNLDLNKIHCVYIMFYGNMEKIGYTNDLNSRLIEIKREYPNNKLVYLREFTKESDARIFEAWLKGLANRELMRFVSTFQDKVRKIEFF